MTEHDTTQPSSEDLQQVEKLQKAYASMKDEMRKIIVGQDEVIDELFMALFCRGHCLLIGVPGLAKTLMISTLSKILNLSFSRIQFTPDLMPSDITGTEVIQQDKSTGDRVFKFLPGPVFANVVLADEINRTPPKTQAALLEAMQERQVSSAGQTRPLPDPFFVLATQNPIEQEGTYPLPEAALDRFLFLIKVDYPSAEEEAEILRRTTGSIEEEVKVVLNAGQLVQLQGLVREVPVADSVIDYAVRLTRATRPSEQSPTFIRQWVTWGAGPRASQNLILAAKARALLQGRFHASSEDVDAVAPSVLRHRILINFAAEAENITPDDVIQQLLQEIQAHPSALDGDRAAGIGS